MSKNSNYCNEANFYEFYRKASSAAMRVVLWVEVGFDGLQNYSRHPSSVNWSSRISSFASEEQRAEEIMKEGKDFYDTVLHNFVSCRQEKHITSDCFTEIKLQGKLHKWR